MKYEALHLSAPGFRNPRSSGGINDDEIRDLALTILQNGLLNPLVVRSSGLILAGQRRYLAIGIIIRWYRGDGVSAALLRVSDENAERFERMALMLIADVPCTIRDDGRAQTLALIENLERNDLSSYDTASYVAEMAQTMTQAEIAKDLGKSGSWVSRNLTAWRTAEADPELAKSWRSGETSLEQVVRRGAGKLPGRGPANRPSIDEVKAELAKIQALLADSPSDSQRLQASVSALEWVIGTRSLAPSETGDLGR